MVDPIDYVFKENSVWINVYQGTEAVQDPFEKDTITTKISPRTIKAVITDLTNTQAKYKMPGIITSRAKTILIERKYRTLLETSQVIEIKTKDRTVEEYEGWKENGRMQLRERGAYLEGTIFSKHT